MGRVPTILLHKFFIRKLANLLLIHRVLLYFLGIGIWGKVIVTSLSQNLCFVRFCGLFPSDLLYRLWDISF